MLTRLTSNAFSIHFFATKIPTPPFPISLPIQKCLYWLFFSGTVLVDAPGLHTSCTQQISIFLWFEVSIISPALPCRVPTFQVPSLNSSCLCFLDCLMMVWQCSGFTLTLLCTGPLSWTPALLMQVWFNIYVYTIMKFWRKGFIVCMPLLTLTRLWWDLDSQGWK